MKGRLDPTRRPGASRLAVVFWWDLVRGLLVLAAKWMYRLRLGGAHLVPASGPVIVASNHQSHFDPVLVGMLVHRRPPTILARSSLFRFAPFAALIRVLGAVPLEREGGDRGAIGGALAELAAGRSLLLFPEGSRTPDGAVAPLKSGVSLLARRSGAPVLPVAIDGAWEAWPKGRPRPRLRGRIAVFAGKPIPAERFKADGAAALEALRAELVRLRALARRANGGDRG